MNLCIKSLVYRLIDLGFEPIGVRKGWEGLINYNHRDPSTYGTNFVALTKNLVLPIDRHPGSFLHSSHLNPSRTPRQRVPEFLREPGEETQDLTDRVMDVVHQLGLTALIVIGYVDMLAYAAQLSQQGVPIIAIPKTIQNNRLKGRVANTHLIPGEGDPSPTRDIHLDLIPAGKSAKIFRETES